MFRIIWIFSEPKLAKKLKNCAFEQKLFLRAKLGVLMCLFSFKAMMKNLKIAFKANNIIFK